MFSSVLQDEITYSLTGSTGDATDWFALIDNTIVTRDNLQNAPLENYRVSRPLETEEPVIDMLLFMTQ